jgi:hydrogenase maturation protein HypF
VEPEVVAFDLHPEYLATKWALEHLAGRRPVAVQHHHAHVVKCMVDAGRVEADGDRAGGTTGLRRVIGVSLDGLGFGADGRLWGGEVLICDALSFRRVAHLEYLPLPGGELAIRRPARTAAGWLAARLGPEAVDRARTAGLELDDGEAAAVLEQVRTGLNAPLTSSCGRLFDCVAALAGLRGAVTYEGQAAIELEMVSRAGGEPYPFEVNGDLGAALSQPALAPAAAPGMLHEPSAAPLAVGLGPLLDAVLADVESGATPGDVGSRLHAAVTALVVDLCVRVRAETGLGEVALTGGVFQNRLLTGLCEDALEDRGFSVLTPALLPANDGGLSVGQAVVAGYTEEDDRGALGPAVE